MTPAQMDTTVLQPAHSYAPGYRGSSIEIELECSCHGIGGRGQRTGLRDVDGIDCAVYQVKSYSHPELDGALAVLTPDGLLFLRLTAAVPKTGTQ